MEKPAAWLTLALGERAGRLIVWTSGEAEMDWGTPDSGGQRHYDLESSGSLRACVDEVATLVHIRKTSVAGGSSPVPSAAIKGVWCGRMAACELR